jgi:hypothetical protein
MNQDDIIRMAQDAGMTPISQVSTADLICTKEAIERFANLVAEAERERIRWDTIHSCHPECDKPVCVAMRKAVAEERESCAKLLDDLAAKDKLSNYYKVAALLIRERGAP